MQIYKIFELMAKQEVFDILGLNKVVFEKYILSVLRNRLA